MNGFHVVLWEEAGWPNTHTHMILSTAHTLHPPYTRTHALLASGQGHTTVLSRHINTHGHTERGPSAPTCLGKLTLGFGHIPTVQGVDGLLGQFLAV